MTRMLKWAVATALALLLSSCALIKVHSWSNPDFKNRPLGKTIVYGIGATDSISHQFEKLFVSYLLKQGVEAHSMHGMIEAPGDLSIDELEIFLKSSGINSLIVTKVLSEDEASSIQGISPVPSAYVSYWSNGDSSSIAVGVSPVSPNVETYRAVLIETNLYDVKTKKLVWSGRNKLYDDRSLEDNMRGVIEAAISDLRKNDLLLKKM